MLVAFYKESESQKANVRVIKFGDRIWVDEEGNIECIREIYFDFKEGELRKIFMLTNIKNLIGLTDITDTFLIEDNLFNKVNSGKYELIDREKRIFGNDFLPNVIAMKLKTLQHSPIGECTYIEAIFDKKLDEPTNFAIRYKFKVNSISDQLGDDNYAFSLEYFRGRTCENECNALNVVRKEIKAITILNMDTKSGGFDILVHLPFGAEILDTSEFCHRTRSKLTTMGTEGESREQCIWHLREKYDNEEGKEIGLNSGNEFHVKYSMLSVKNRVEMFKNEMLEENTKLKAELGELKKTTSSLKNDTEAMKDGDKKIQRKVSIGGKIQIICLILAIIAIILVFIV
jgi:hypothetical protein